MPRKPIKIAHTSDVHLDSRFTDVANGFRNRAERAFAEVVDLTISESVDLFLIAGDLFDSNRIRDEDIEFVYEQLGRVQCQVVLIPGNHDVHDENSLWKRVDLSNAGDHVHALMEHKGETVELAHIGATVWGKGMAEHAPENMPLEGVAQRSADLWHIGMAHGDVVLKPAGMGSSPITHAEIEDSGLDYLALGHIHVWREHNQGGTTAFYPGSPVGAFASAAGGHVGLVTMHPDRGMEVERRHISSDEPVNA